MPSLHLIRAVQTPAGLSELYPYSGVRGIHQCRLYDNHDFHIVTDEGVIYHVNKHTIPVTERVYEIVHNGVAYNFEMDDATIIFIERNSSIHLCRIDFPWSIRKHSLFHINVISHDDNTITVDLANYQIMATVVVHFCTLPTPNMNC